MEDLSEALNLSYDIHPDFSTDKRQFIVNQVLLREFEEAHGEIRDYIPFHLRKSHIQGLNQIVGKIADDLSSQASGDVFLQQFIQELFAQVKSYLNSEHIYRTRISSRKVQSDSHHTAELKSKNCFFENMDQKITNSILEVTNDLFVEFRERAKKGQTKRSDLSVSSGPIVEKVNHLVDIEFSNRGIFEAMSEFVGIDFDHTGCSIELSVAGSSWWKNNMTSVPAPKTMYAHLDETKFAPKSILYLSRVEERHGPTSYYPGLYNQFKNNTLKDIIGRVIGTVGSDPNSELHEFYRRAYHQPFSSQEFRSHFMRLPKELRFNSHFGWDVMPGTTIESEMASIEKKMLGEPGRYIVFDGSMLLHRGGLIESGERKVLQIVFWPKMTRLEKIKSRANYIKYKIQK